MLVKSLIDNFYLVFKVFFLAIPNIPDLPDQIYSYVDTLGEYVGVGLGILSNYTHLSYLLSLFGIVVIVEVVIMAYKFIMWVLKKIPLIGIS